MHRRGGNALIEVRDNGPGIASEHQKAIFAEFYQVGNKARDPDRGLGLGLAIVDRLARALDVEVTVRSASDRGSTFGLQVQIATSSTAASLPESSESGAVIHVVGAGLDLQASIALARNWRYEVSHDPDATGRPTERRRPLIVIALASIAATLRASYPATIPIIALDDAPEVLLPQDTYRLSLPIQPAKLRALLGYLQRAWPKSMP